MGTNSDSVRRENLSTVLRLVHRSAGVSRSALTTATALNRSTIAALVSELTDRGLVEEKEAEPTNRVGRPSPRVLPAPEVVAIAVNPELDAVTLGVVGLGARVLQRVRHEVDHPLTPEEAVDITAGLIRDLDLGARRVIGIGMAVPGLVRRTDGLVRWAPHLGWTDAPVAELVRDATGRATSVANDASLGAIAEHLFGAGRGLSDVIYLNGGASGIGGGVIVDGRPLTGSGGYAGEFGQNRPGIGDPTDRRSPYGTLEDEVSRARLLDAVGIVAADEPTLREAVLDSSAGTVVEELTRQRRVLAAALSNAINVFNPELALLGGFLATILESDPADLEALVAVHAIPASLAEARIAPAALGDDLLMIGAAELAFGRLLDDPTLGFTA